jgi:hypothetical protein
MAKAMGVDSYTASDCNRTHLVDNVIMQYISTGTTCFIYMPESYIDGGMWLNGQPISDEDKAYAMRYKAKSSAAAVTYRTLNVKNISRIAIGGEVYDICISQQQAALAG